MLKQLTIQNYVLVDSLDVQFDPGLTTVTGESGAGKSIIMGALGLLRGERAKTDTVRPGANKADIAAEFDLADLDELKNLLQDHELLDDEPDACLIRRVISAEGRSRAFINGTPVTLQTLQQAAALLVDIYGQNEHQRLAQPLTQLRLLDDYAGLTQDAKSVGALYRGWQQTASEIERLESDVAAQTDRADLLTYQLNELEELALEPGEFEKIAMDQKRLAEAGDRLTLLDSTLGALEDASNLRQVSAQLEAVDDDQADLASGKATLASVLELIDDAATDLRRYQEQIVVDPELLAVTEARLSLVLDLARKHKVEPERLHAEVEALRAELDGIRTDSSDLEELRRRLDEEEAAFRKAASKLSKARKKHAKKFAAAVSTCMQSLGIGAGALTVEFNEVESERGLDAIEFVIQTNEALAPGSLAKVASGGEQTRIALSIQIVAAETSALPCLVLDEADVGVGGTTADTVGRILRDLARHTQIICVTHAPQVAALGHNHLRVSKAKDATHIDTIDADERIEELARMLAGAGVTAKSREYASTLLADANG